MNAIQVNEIQVPPAIAMWLDGVVLVFLVLVVLWVILKLLGFFMRRAYNLTPVESASSKNLKPDFLTINHDARERQIERGTQFPATPKNGYTRALTVTRIAVVFMALVSFVSAVFLAFARIESVDSAWKSITLWDRFVTIIQEYQIGFAFAVLSIASALIKLILRLYHQK